MCLPRPCTPRRDCGQAAALRTGSVSAVPVGQQPLRKGLLSIKKSNRQGSEPDPITSLRRRNSPAASLHGAPADKALLQPLVTALRPALSSEGSPPAARGRRQTWRRTDKRPQDRSDKSRPAPRGRLRAVPPSRTRQLRPRPDLSTPFKKRHDEDKYLAISAPSTTT